MHVDFVIVTYHSEAVIGPCLESIFRYTPDPKTVFVIDNGSEDGTLREASSFPNAIILANGENAGYAKAANRGIRAGSGDVIAVMNADTKVTEGWLEPLLDCLLGDEKVALVGPKMINRHNQLVSTGTDWNWTMPSFMEQNRQGLLEETRDCMVINGACFLMKRELTGRLGLMDENYFFYFEETDYCFQALHNGYRVVYCPQSLIYHEYENNTPLRSDMISKHWNDSRDYFDRKWAGRPIRNPHGAAD
ncbi:glycosyltransferase family 2 protein [Paenibacillus sp. MBLB4367]|uniref:glycosyltransferase family 2 protein n=1 Tax=Paenibacillus sp. MBLB4367 TaxID=3384767 RepID=UPI0039083B7E